MEYVLANCSYTVTEGPFGYPNLANFLSSEENFMIYRKFGYLQARLLLFKQDQLRWLEWNLENMDSAHEKKSPDLLTSRERDDARSGKRKVLLDKIMLTFLEYS
jgi:hypothetical protein